jgi:hypothetical protein
MSRLAVAATVRALLTGAAGGTTEQPALRLVRIDPLIVRGLGFRSNDGRELRVRLGRVPAYDPCATLSVQARGSLGSRASISTLPRLCAVRQP